MNQELNERVLPDDYPVYWDYYYVVDGKVVRSDVNGNVMTLKRDLYKLTGVMPKEVK